MMKMNTADETDKLIQDLINERDYRLATIIPGNEQREYNIRAYNKFVIDTIEYHIQYFEIEFYRGHRFGLSKIKDEDLRLREYFGEWFLKFGGNTERNTIELSIPAPIEIYSKLKWVGTPSQFGFIIDSLIACGFLKRPTSSYKKDAEYYFALFDIDSTIETLAKELSETTNSLNTSNRKKFIIPSKNEL